MNNLSATTKVGKIKKLKTTKVYVIPYLVWSFIFLIIPVFILIFMAFSTYDFSTGANVEFTLKNWKYVFGAESRTVFWPSIGKSLLISFLVTLLCLIIGYPTAFVMTKIKARYRALIMALLILPLWMNQVLRIVSWRTIFEILKMNRNELYIFNIIVAMTSMYLPFMIVPIFTVLEKIDPKVVEASYDLGSNKVNSFLRVTLPLSLGGIVSGIIMTFLPSLTQFEVSDAISYNNVVLLGNLIYTRFKGTGGFNVGSVFSLFTVLFTIIGFILLLRVDKEGETLI
ncbi:MAG: ABC transporter permease [Gammaproteobacteria bacterium]|nr:ABC transporter permease [Gammaproteobacteria bacterium]